jgi:hypothetical protein
MATLAKAELRQTNLPSYMADNKQVEEKHTHKKKDSKRKVGTLPVIIIRFLHPNRESGRRKEQGN